MKHQQNNDNEVSAIAFMRSFDETMNLMESIGDNTAQEQHVLQESAVHMENYTNDDGIFEMESLLDVDVSDSEENQPRMYNSPTEELTDSDKQLIVDEFAEQLSNMHEEVIDFSDVGPIATVIQDKFGFKQNLDDFLTGLMTSAADKQDSQSFAHGKTIPGVAVADEANTVAPAEVGGPTDITPTQAGPQGTGVEVSVDPMMDPSMCTPVMDEIPLGEPTMDEIPLDEPVMDEMSVGDGLDEIDAGSDDSIEEIDSDDDSLEEIGSTEDEDEDEDEDDDSLGFQLEAIRVKHLGKTLVESIDDKLNAIRNNLLEATQSASTQNQNEFEKNADSAECTATDAADDMKKDGLDTPATEDQDGTAKMETIDMISPMLESIAAKYHANENNKVAKVQAKLEAIATESKLDAQLESIANGYHSGIKAQLEAVTAESKLDEKLSTLVESYHSQTKVTTVDTKSNIEARKQAKAKIEELSK